MVLIEVQSTPTGDDRRLLALPGDRSPVQASVSRALLQREPGPRIVADRRSQAGGRGDGVIE